MQLSVRRHECSIILDKVRHCETRKAAQAKPRAGSASCGSACSAAQLARAAVLSHRFDLATAHHSPPVDSRTSHNGRRHDGSSSCGVRPSKTGLKIPSSGAAAMRRVETQMSLNPGLFDLCLISMAQPTSPVTVSTGGVEGARINRSSVIVSRLSRSWHVADMLSIVEASRRSRTEHASMVPLHGGRASLSQTLPAEPRNLTALGSPSRTSRRNPTVVRAEKKELPRPSELDEVRVHVK